MLYSEKMPIFTAKYPAQTITVDGAAYRYVRSGAGRDKTLVLLNGGMNTLEMWMDYVEPLSKSAMCCCLTTRGSCALTRHWWWASMRPNYSSFPSNTALARVSPS